MRTIARDNWRIRRHLENRQAVLPRRSGFALQALPYQARNDLPEILAGGSGKILRRFEDVVVQ